MGFLILAGVLLLIIFGFAFYSYSFSMDERNAKISKALLIITGILGAVLVCLSCFLFFALLSGSKADGAERTVIADSFVLYAVIETVIVAIGLAITFLSSLIKSPLRPVIPVVLPLWGIITLFLTAVWSAWSDFEVFSSSVFVMLYGSGGAFLLAFSALPQMIERAKTLSDSEKRRELMVALRAKRAKKESRRNEKKRLREKKKRLSHPKKK